MPDDVNRRKDDDEMMIVIADDITGAAEIGGICISHGLKTGLTTDAEDVAKCVAMYDVLVIATDTRGMNAEDACACTRRIAALLSSLPQGYRLFKKTDSALRGHIIEELETLLTETKYKKVRLLPQNPSKGRVVENGVYKIDGTPLSETSFAYDPEFPAVTSVVSERLRLSDDIMFCNAADTSGVEMAVSGIDGDTLPAGAADFFMAYIKKLAADGTLQIRHDNAGLCGLDGNTAIIVCGSTQSADLYNMPYIKKIGAHVVPMTREAFYGTDTAEWEQKALKDYQQHGSIVLTIGFPPEDGGAGFALRLRRQMGNLCSLLVSHGQPAELVIEGGATAFAVLDSLGWRSFAIENEIAPGVIRLRYAAPQGGSVHITMKPGSYPWGETFKVGGNK